MADEFTTPKPGGYRAVAEAALSKRLADERQREADEARDKYIAEAPLREKLRIQGIPLVRRMLASAAASGDLSVYISPEDDPLAFQTLDKLLEFRQELASRDNCSVRMWGTGYHIFFAEPPAPAQEAVLPKTISGRAREAWDQLREQCRDIVGRSYIKAVLWFLAGFVAACWVGRIPYLGALMLGR